MRIEGYSDYSMLFKAEDGATTKPENSGTPLPGMAPESGGDRLELSAAGIEEQKRLRARDGLPAGKSGDEPLDARQQEQVRKLERIERSVIMHEMAHMAGGAGIVSSGPRYQYQEGPDGKRYIVGGEVGISVSPEDTPEATIRKMQRVQSAALAPADPSAQDRAVASAAAQLQMQAQMELARQRMESIGGSGEESETGQKNSAYGRTRGAENASEMPGSTETRNASAESETAAEAGRAGNVPEARPAAPKPGNAAGPSAVIFPLEI